MNNVERISIDSPPPGFLKWVQGVCDNGLRYEIVIESGFVSHVYVSEVDNGDWQSLKGEKFLRLLGSSEMKLRQRVYRPRIVHGKFIENYDE